MNSTFSPSSEQTLKFLMSVHDTVPGITESVLRYGKTAEGRSSYEILAGTASLESGMAAVDLACGNGTLTQIISPMVGTCGQVIGIDLNHSELDLARIRSKSYGNVRFLEESANALSLSDASVDAVLCHMALMLFYPPEPPLMEIARILRPSGILAAVIPGVNSGNSLFTAIRKTLAKIVSQEIAAENLVMPGSPEFSSPDKIKNLFARTGQFDDDMQFTDFEVME